MWRGGLWQFSTTLCVRVSTKRRYICIARRSYGLNSNTHRPRFFYFFGAIQMHVPRTNDDEQRKRKKTYAAFPCIFISMRFREKNKVCADGGGGCVRYERTPEPATNRNHPNAQRDTEWKFNMSDLMKAGQERERTRKLYLIASNNAFTLFDYFLNMHIFESLSLSLSLVRSQCGVTFS